MNAAKEALRRAVANGTAPDWSEIAPPRPARAPSSYLELTKAAAADLERVLRAGHGRGVYLRAWESYVDGKRVLPGILFVEVDGEPMRPDPYAGHRTVMPPVLRPHIGRWESCPFSGLPQAVWSAARDARIMGSGDT